MNVLDWLYRSTGAWRSERRYLFQPCKSSKATDLTTDFTIGLLDRPNELRIEWQGQTSGTMDLRLEGDVLHRSRDYFGEGAHSSKVQLLDDDTLLLLTTYNGLNFREEIRFLQNDTYRLRQTVGTDDDGVARIVGQYWEFRTL